jgi:hypothetical protein
MIKNLIMKLVLHLCMRNSDRVFDAVDEMLANDNSEPMTDAEMDAAMAEMRKFE